MIDELKRIIMGKFHFSEEQYWGEMLSYSINVLASSDVITSIENYAVNRNPEMLTEEAEMRIARDYFGGYGSGRY